MPTIIAGDFAARKASVPGFYPPQVAAKAAAIGPLILGTAGRAYKAGVKIAFGTDAGVYPHGQNAHEFELMVQAGMPPLFTTEQLMLPTPACCRKRSTGPVIDAPAVAAILKREAIMPIQKQAALRGIADKIVVYEIP